MSVQSSRKHPPEPNQNRLWKAGYAWSAFQSVVETCDYISTKHIQPDDEIYYPLLTAICVLYARPFKRSNGIKKMSEEFVPKKFLWLHRLLILLRDKTMAHSDASENAARFKGLPANHVQLFIRNGGREIALGMNQSKFNTTGISKIRDLASTLANGMLEHIRRYPGDIPDGAYLIDLSKKTFRRSDFKEP